MYRTNYSVGPQYFGTSAKKSWFDEGDRCAPGPGAHKPRRIDKNSIPVWTSGKSTQRDSFLDKSVRSNPSPDRYKVTNLNQTHISQPKYSVPVYQHIQNPNKIDQGNSLDYKPKYGVPKIKYPSYSFGYYFDRDYSTRVPPPDNYKPMYPSKKDFNRTQKSFSVADRPMPYGQQGRYPYVGKYNVNGDMGGHQYSIGQGHRPQLPLGNSKQIFYQIGGQMVNLNKGKTMGLRIPVPIIKDFEDFPSPDKYNPKLPITARSFIDYKGKRSQMGNLAVAKNPSPNKYEPDVWKGQQTVSFTKFTNEILQKTHVPGVGTYEVQSKFNTQLGNMGLKLKKLTQDEKPSPNTYDPREHLTKPTAQRTVNYYSNRTDFSKSITGKKVGPGAYQVAQQTPTILGKMGKNDKFQPNRNKNPGPGNYQIPSGIGKLPKYCAGPKKMTETGFSVNQLKRQERLRIFQQKQRQRLKAEQEAELLRQQQQQEAATQPKSEAL